MLKTIGSIFILGCVLIFALDNYPIAIGIVTSIILDKFFLQKVPDGWRFFLWAVIVFVVTSTVSELTGYKPSSGGSSSDCGFNSRGMSDC
jgi:uncharacterized membrane protein YgcG